MEYKRIELDLSVARTDQELSFDGYYTAFMIVKRDSDFQYKINSKTADALYSNEMQGFQGKGVFSKLYVSNEAGSGKAVIVIYK